MKYVEMGYKEIERGVWVKTFEPYEDGTVATEKQKNAIRNLKSYLACGDKENHSCLGKRETKRIEKLTKVQAMKEIGLLIKEVKSVEASYDDCWDGPF